MEAGCMLRVAGKVGEAAELGGYRDPKSHSESGSISAQPPEVEGLFANQRGCTNPHDSCRSGAHRSGMGDKAVWSHILFLSCAGSSSVFVYVHMYVSMYMCMYVWEHVCVHICVGACVCACICGSMCMCMYV